MLYERVTIEDLKIEKYNRPIDMHRAKKIAASFNEYLFDPIIVNRHEGIYTIIDGQHRVVVAKLLGHKDIMCKVIEGLEYEKEAQLFTEYNGKTTRKSLDAYELLKGKYESGDDLAVRLHKIASLFGFSISDQVGDNKLACASTLMSIISRCGADLFANVLSITNGAWHGDKESLRGQILDGITMILTTYGERIDRERLAEKLKTVSPTKMIADADADPNGGQKKIKVARQMLRYYNKNIPSNKKIQNTL